MASRRAHLRNAKVQQLAITQLTKKHQDRYRQLFEEFKDEGLTAGKSQTRARSVLCREFPTDYRTLYLDIKKDFPLD